jgi:WD40 repeat protein
MATYDGFISYAHREERDIAARLQESVEKCVPPLFRTRGLHLFRDKRSFGANPDLWPSLDEEMADSRWFILIATRQAAESEGVNHEIAWWLKERSADRMVIVDADGSLAWDKQARAFSETSTAVPPALRGLRREPRFVPVPDSEVLTDQEVDDVAVYVAARLRGMKPDDLFFKREEAAKRLRRIRNWTITVLLVLLAMAIGAFILALEKNADAEAKAKLSLSRQIAAASEAVAPTNLDAAMLLAVKGFDTDPNSQTRAALFNADTSSPNLVRFLQAGSKVTALAGTPKGHDVLAGTTAGEVLLWPSDRGAPRKLFTLSRGITDVAISRDGSVIVAADPAEAVLWRKGGALVKLPVPKGDHGWLASVSPSGRTVVYAARSSDYEHSVITVAPVSDPTTGVRHPDPVDTSTIVVQSDRRVLLASPGEWNLEDFAHWAGKSDRLPFGARVYGLAVSPDGTAISDTNGATNVPVWKTANSESSAESPDSYAEAPVAQQIQIALSPGGTKLAVAAPNEVYVAPVKQASEVTSQVDEIREVRPLSMTGQTPSLVIFVDDTHLLSAAGKTIGVWNTGQLDRLAEPESIPLEYGCELCAAPALSISPDGKRLTIVNGSNSFALVQGLDGSERNVLPEAMDVAYEFTYGAPVWGDGGGVLAFPVWPAVGGQEPTFPIPHSLPPFVRLWAVGNRGEGELVDGPADGGRSAIIVGEEGKAFLQDVVTGLVRSSWRTAPPHDEEQDTAAALSRSGRLLAIAREDEVRVEQVPGGKVVSRFPIASFAALSFTAGHLLVELGDGSIQVRDEAGADLDATIPGASGGNSVASPAGNFIGRAADGLINLVELSSGTRVATFRTPGESFFFKSGLAFTPNGKILVTVSELPGEDERGQLVRRDLSDAALIRVACAAAGHDLDAAEWRSLVGTNPPAELGCSPASES